MTPRTQQRHRASAGLRLLIACGLPALLLSGCVSAAKYDLDIRVPAVANPATGVAVVITEVKDARLFVASELTGRDASPHQLATGSEDDPAVTRRSFAQMRGNEANPLYDFLLPPGRSVADLTREALESGLRRAGFRVLAPEDPAAAAAPQLNAEILRFWAWNSGKWTFTFNFEAEVALRGQLAPYEEGRSVTGTVQLRSAVATSPRSFENTTTKGLWNFIANLTKEVETGR